MKNNNIKKLISIMLVTIFLVSTNVVALKISSNKIEKNNKEIKKTNFFEITDENSEDYDPLVDIKLNVSINEIRALDRIDSLTDPDFYVKLIINGKEHQSPVFEKNQKHITPDWTIEQNIPDDKEFVEITIQLWDKNPIKDTLCDIACNDNNNANRKDLTIYYSVKTGHWFGDDMIYTPHSWYVDYSGYGRGNGCDDNSIYEKDQDCEIYFDIQQNDYDNDSIPYWTEVNIYGTDPEINNAGEDQDNDGIPIEWEHKWGHEFSYNYSSEAYDHKWFYHPFKWNNHEELDPDGDALNNIEEYLTSQWNSDPFRKDVFVELDQMKGGPNGEISSKLPNGSKELIKEAFNRQNIVFHLDDGRWENSGSDMIPFDNLTEASWNNPNNELNQIYDEYFINNTEEKWRFGVFHYGVVIYQSSVVNGNAFGCNCYQISAKGMEEKARMPFPITGNRDVVYASAYMHELGHSLGLMWLGGHSKDAYYPWQPLWWKYRPYRSIMNYGYMYGSLWNLVDYSDGSRGKNDFDDWNNIDYYYFQQEEIF